MPFKDHLVNCPNQTGYEMIHHIVSWLGFPLSLAVARISKWERAEWNVCIWNSGENWSREHRQISSKLCHDSKHRTFEANGKAWTFSCTVHVDPPWDDREDLVEISLGGWGLKIPHCLPLFSSIFNHSWAKNFCYISLESLQSLQ